MLRLVAATIALMGTCANAQNGAVPFREARASFRAGNFSECLQQLRTQEQAATKDSDRREVSVELARVLCILGQHEQARLVVADIDTRGARPKAGTSDDGTLKGIRLRLSFPRDAYVGDGAVAENSKTRFARLAQSLDVADKAATRDERLQFLEKFLEDSADYLTEFPDHWRAWQLRARVCLELGKKTEGIQAAQAIKTFGVPSLDLSGDDVLVEMMDGKRWFGDVGVAAPRNPVREMTAQSQWTPERHVVSDFGIELVPIHAGSFVMGSPENEAARLADEGPRTTVSFATGFWMGATEVTQGQWRAVMGASIQDEFRKTNRGATLGNVGDDFPMDFVTWLEALVFCRRLTVLERASGRLPKGYVYTLPTEAQWEYACRAGVDGPWAGELGEMAVYRANDFDRWERRKVAQKRSNPWGLHDMYGNVAERCLDCYTNQLPGGDVFDLRAPPRDGRQAVRGGDHGKGPAGLRSAARQWDAGNSRFEGIGFRIVLVPVGL
ncbi:MAG: formylglycine-generating enzyme family protein [Nibricoccus sp.]